MDNNSSAQHPPTIPSHTAPINPIKPPSTKRMKNGTTRDVLSTVGALITALLVALALITFVFQSYQVDGPSMENTLQNNDRLVVWKLPRTWARITSHPFIPKRGDIVVFTESEGGLQACGQFESKQLIKRVIGLPGDRVVVNNGYYTIYNAQHPNGFDPDKTLPYHNQITETTTGNIDITLSKTQVFVSGDNRTNSCDSRNFGPINANQISGTLALRLLPLSTAERF